MWTGIGVARPGSASDALTISTWRRNTRRTPSSERKATSIVAVALRAAVVRTPCAGVEESPAMIDAKNLVKHYGSTTAVDDLSFVVQPGIVTGFLGPNGSGKSTTMRMMIGLDHPDKG